MDAASAAISISERRWRAFESSFPFGPPTVVVCMLLWVLFQLWAFSDRADWPLWLKSLPVLEISHATSFTVATIALLVLFAVRCRSLVPLGFRTEGLGADLRWFALAALAMAGIYLALAGLAYLGLLLFAEDPWAVFRRHMHQSFFKDDSVPELLRVIILYPMLEEIWYRGLLYTPLRANRGRVVAILATAVIFALAHGTAWPVNQFLGGLVFAVAYEARRGLIAPTLLHMAGNGALAALGWAWMRWMA